jgi:hypothetical protein
MRTILILLVLGAVPFTVLPAAPPATPDLTAAAGDASTSGAIVMHTGIPGVVYLGQPLEELLEKLPGADVKRIANRATSLSVRLEEAGVSCLVVGPSEKELKVASLRFELDRVYDTLVRDGYRTDGGIGPGSTVNDLVATHGKPSEIYKGSGAPTPRAAGAIEGPDAYEKYQYASPDGAVSTYFVIHGSNVQAIVLNQKEPLRQQLTRRPGE